VFLQARLQSVSLRLHRNRRPHKCFAVRIGVWPLARRDITSRDEPRNPKLGEKEHAELILYSPVAWKSRSLSKRIRRIFLRTSQRLRIFQRKYEGAQYRKVDAVPAHQAGRATSGCGLERETAPAAPIHHKKSRPDRKVDESLPQASGAESNPAPRLLGSAVLQCNRERAGNWPALPWKHIARILRSANMGRHRHRIGEGRDARFRVRERCWKICRPGCAG